jgi:hypothetical protein
MASGVKVRPRLPSLSAVTDSLLSPTLNMQVLCLRFSTSWNEPHFEKPLVTQAQAIQIYSRAYGEWHSPEDLAAAQNIQGYIRHFLTNSDGAFYVGQGGDVVSARDSVSYFALSGRSGCTSSTSTRRCRRCASSFEILEWSSGSVWTSCWHRLKGVGNPGSIG